MWHEVPLRYLRHAAGYPLHHGAGLSQYGADYLAEEGYTWQEILQHYYTGVEIELM